MALAVFPRGAFVRVRISRLLACAMLLLPSSSEWVRDLKPWLARFGLIPMLRTLACMVTGRRHCGGADPEQEDGGEGSAAGRAPGHRQDGNRAGHRTGAREEGEFWNPLFRALVK